MSVNYIAYEGTITGYDGAQHKAPIHRFSHKLESGKEIPINYNLPFANGQSILIIFERNYSQEALAIYIKDIDLTGMDAKPLSSVEQHYSGFAGVVFNLATVANMLKGAAISFILAFFAVETALLRVFTSAVLLFLLFAFLAKPVRTVMTAKYRSDLKRHLQSLIAQARSAR